MPHSLRLDPSAIDDLNGIADWITGQADVDTAKAYTQRIRVRCARFTAHPRIYPVRSRSRATIYSAPFESSATILFRVTKTEVVILRVLRRGRDVDRIVRRTR